MTRAEEQIVRDARVAGVDMKLEVVVIPVPDVDRAKRFYGTLGWRLDADFQFDNGFRVVQFTPPGSGTSIQFGTKITPVAAGSAKSLYLVVSDTVAAREQIVARGVKVSEVFRPGGPGTHFQPDGSSTRLSGPSPDHTSYRSYATSAIQTVTHGCCRRSRRDCLDTSSTARRTPRYTVWRAPFDARRPSMVSMSKSVGRTTPLTRLKRRVHRAEQAG